jgi:hypothetical protein
MADEVKDETSSFQVTSNDSPKVNSTPEETITNEEPNSSEEGKSEENEPESTGSDSEESKGEEEKDGDKKDSSEDATAETDSGKNGKGFQKRINKVVREREEAKREAERLKQEIQELKNSKESTQEPSKLEEPKESDYESYGEYLDALDEYDKKTEDSKSEIVEKKEVKENSSSDKKEDAGGLTEAQETALAVIQEVLKESKKPEDFDKVALDDSVPVTGEMLEAIAECENPVEVMYYLGKNKDIAGKIAGTSAVKQAMEIAAIDKANTKPKKPVELTKVKDPINPVAPSDSMKKPKQKMSFSEYEAERNREEMGKKSSW